MTRNREKMKWVFQSGMALHGLSLNYHSDVYYSKTILASTAIVPFGRAIIGFRSSSAMF